MFDSVLNLLLLAESAGIVVLAGLAIREALYMRRLVNATRGAELWLIDLLSKVNRRLTLGCVYFGILVVVRLFFGQQSIAWSSPVSGLVLIGLLATTIAIGHELRDRKGPQA